MKNFQSLIAPQGRWPRAIVAFALAFFAARMGGAASHSEQFYIALCLAWIFDAMTSRDIFAPEKRRFIVPTVIVLVATWVVFSHLTQQQARGIEGRAPWHEAAWKMWHVGGLFVLYALWSRALYSAISLLRPKRARQNPAPLWMKLLARSIAIVAFAPLIFTSFNAHRTKVGNAYDPSDVKLAYQTVSFRSDDNLLLRGWWIPAPKKTARSVVVCHGVGANSAPFLGLAPFLHRAGFNVLFFDFRGHGDSQGHTVSFGWNEARDVRAACKYLQMRGQTQIALYGWSMGGGAVSLSFHPRLKTDGEFERVVRAVIVDSTFAEFQPLVDRQFTFLPPSLRPIFSRVLGFYSWWEIGVTPRNISPASVIQNVSQRPLLIIHGDADKLIDVRQARQLFNAARQPKQLKIVPKAGHCLTRIVDPKPYEQQVAAWLRRAMPE